jgi:hypothetical protein
MGNKFGSVRNALNVWRDDQAGGLAAYGLLGTQRVFLQRYEDLVANFTRPIMHRVSRSKVGHENIWPNR